MAIIDVEDLVGSTFPMPNSSGKQCETTIVEAIRYHEDRAKNSSEHVKFKVRRNNDLYEDILTYNEIMDHINEHRESSVYWELHHIVSHQALLHQHHPDYKGSPYNVKVEWEMGSAQMNPWLLLHLMHLLLVPYMLGIMAF